MSKLPELKATPIGTIVNASTGKQIAVLTKGGRSEKELTAYARRFVACCNCHDALVAVCEMAYKEGYESGYADGIEADESCVPETTIFKNDFAKAWNESEAKAALEKVKVKNE